MAGIQFERYCEKCGKHLYTRTNIYDGKYQDEVKNILTLCAYEKDGQIYCQYCGGQADPYGL